MSGDVTGVNSVTVMIGLDIWCTGRGGGGGIGGTTVTCGTSILPDESRFFDGYGADVFLVEAVAATVAAAAGDGELIFRRP